MNEPVRDLLGRGAALLRQGRRCTFCLVVRSRGSTPQSAGALMLVDDAATTFGTIGGGCVEAEVRRRAFELAAQGRSGLLTFKLDHDYGWDDGLICGGTLDIAVAPAPAAPVLESILADLGAGRATSLSLDVDSESGPQRYTLNLPVKDRLLIAGAGHVGQAVARLALRLDFDVAVVDDREDLLRASAPEGASLIAGDIAEHLRQAAIDDRTFCVIVTRGHRHDEQALAAVVGRGARYVGMIGSRRKVKLIFDDLRAMGIDQSALDAVRAPIGAAIGAVTVEEIAISIAAELVQVRRQHSAKAVEGPLPVAVATPAAPAVLASPSTLAGHPA